MQILHKTTWIIFGILFGLLSARGQQQWQAKTSMPSPRQGMAAAVLSDRIYVMGGSQFEQNALDIVEAYDTQQDIWQTNFAALNVARTNASAVSFGGKLYIFGGRNHNQMIPEVEMYDPANNQWSIISQLPTPREGLATAVMDSLVWVIGGANFQTNYDIVEIYNPSDNSWNTLPHLLTVPRVTTVAAVLDGELYVFGGFYFGPLNSYEKYVAGQGWIASGNMLYAFGAASGVVVDSRVWIVGGENQSGFLTNVQYADLPGSGNWHNGPPMQTARKSLSVARVGNTLFAIGGKSGHHMGGTTDAVEALDVLTGITMPPGEYIGESFYLTPSFPNPFNGSTSFEVYVEKASGVQIGITNVLGQIVRSVYHGRLVGWHRFNFDGRDDFGKMLPSGNYFIYLIAPGKRHVIKTTFSK